MLTGKKVLTKTNFKAKIDVRTYTMVGALILLSIMFHILTDGMFFVTRNLSNLARQMAIVGVLATGMSLVIISGNIDLSVGSVLGFLGGLSSVLIVWNQWGMIPTIVLILLLGMFIGLVQGTIIACCNVPAFIVTLGGLLVFKGGLLGLTKGTSIAPFPKAYVYIGQAYISKPVGWVLAAVTIALLIMSEINKRRSRMKYDLEVIPFNLMIARATALSLLILAFVAIMNSYRGIPVPVLLMLILVAVFTFIAEKTTFGRSIYAIGGNIEAAKFSGLNVRRNLITVYILNGLMAAIAGIILSARLNAGTPTAGDGMELDAIASAVIGGISMAGGEGKVPGAILGALLMATIDNGMSLMNVEAFWQYIVKGIILVGAIWFDLYTKNKR